MREKVLSKKIKGKFIIFDKHVFDNIYCDYSYNLYSNHNMKGCVYLDFISKEIYNEHTTNSKCEFFSIYGDYIIGNVSSLPIPSGKIEFDIKEIVESHYYSEERSNKLNVLYYIPFIKPLCREIIRPFSTDNNILFTFMNNEFEILLENFKINFIEEVKLVKHIKPDYLLNRFLYPNIKIEIKDNEKISEVLKYYYNSIDRLFLIISILLFFRIKPFGYEVYAFNNDIITFESKFRESLIKSTEDYDNDVGSKFKKYFNGENISILYNSYKKLGNIKTENYTRILNSYLSLSEIKLFEIKFRDTYFLLCAISKVLLDVKNRKRDEDLIKESCKLADINLENINFEISPNRINDNKSECEWLITEYRHELTHYNFIKYDKSKMYKEFEKMIILLRKLILFYLEPKLKEIPYPKNSIWN